MRNFVRVQATPPGSAGSAFVRRTPLRGYVPPAGYVEHPFDAHRIGLVLELPPPELMRPVDRRRATASTRELTQVDASRRVARALLRGLSTGPPLSREHA